MLKPNFRGDRAAFLTQQYDAVMRPLIDLQRILTRDNAPPEHELAVLISVIARCNERVEEVKKEHEARQAAALRAEEAALRAEEAALGNGAGEDAK